MFKNINESFFVPLAYPNKAMYWDCIQLLFARAGLRFSAEREILLEELKDYFSKPLSAELRDENGDALFSTSNPTERASFVLRTLQNCGWLELEIDKSYVQHINFTEAAIKIFQTLQRIESDEQTEYSGRIITIYSLAKISQKDNPDIILERMYDETRQLITELQTLNANMKHYIDTLSKNKTVKELMNVLMNDYVENVVNKAYHRLMTSDNISKVRPEIINLLTYRSRNTDYMKRVTEGFMDRLELTEEEANSHAKELIYFILEEFRNIDYLIDEINRKNRNYINSAINRTKFLMADTEDVKGQLKGILSMLNNQINDNELDLHSIYELEYLESLVHIYSSSFLDENSLYQPPAEKAKFQPVAMTEDEIDPALQDEKIRKLMAKVEKALNPEKINRYALTQLADKDEMKMSELPLNEVDDFIKLIYIQLYGNRKNMGYVIENQDNCESKVVNGYSFKDCTIRRK